jgi:hypothetical protein
VNDRFGATDTAVRACPPVDRREHRAHQAALDAVDLVASVRDYDPREVWGTLHLRQQRDPLRLIALCVALAAMVPEDRPARELLAWTDELAQPKQPRRVA